MLKRFRGADEVQRGKTEGLIPEKQVEGAKQGPLDTTLDRQTTGQSSSSSSTANASFARLRSSRARTLSTPGPSSAAHDAAQMRLKSSSRKGKRSRALLPEEMVADLVAEKEQKLPELPLISPFSMNTGGFSASSSVSRSPSSSSVSAAPRPCIASGSRRRSASTVSRGRPAMEQCRVGRAFSSSALYQADRHCSDDEVLTDEDETDAFFRAHGFASDSPVRRDHRPGDRGAALEEIDDVDVDMMAAWEHRASFTTDLKLRRKDTRSAAVDKTSIGESSASEAENDSEVDDAPSDDGEEEGSLAQPSVGTQRAPRMPGSYMSLAEVAQTMPDPSPPDSVKPARAKLGKPAPLALKQTHRLRRSSTAKATPPPERTTGILKPSPDSVSPSVSPAESPIDRTAPRDRARRSERSSAELSSPVAPMIIAVIGQKRSGKTTLIQRGLRKASKGHVLLENAQFDRVTAYQATVQVSGVLQKAEILEIDTAMVSFSEQGIVWPAEMPAAHGAMVCYDATNPKSLNGVKMVLNGLWKRGGISSVVLAAKSSSEEKLNRVNPHSVAEMCGVYGVGVIQLDGGVEDENKKMRNSFGWIIRRILAINNISSPAASRASTALSFASPDHFAKSIAGGSIVKSPSGKKSHWRETSAGNLINAPSPPLSKSEQLAMPQSPATALPQSPATAHLPTHTQLGVRPGDLDLFFSKEEIIDKFLFSAVAGNDEGFAKLFLVIFRRFTRPSEVLDLLIKRFESLAQAAESSPHLSRHVQQRLCNVLSRWLHLYPGDFVAGATYTRLKDFLASLVLQQHLTHYAVELLPILHKIAYESVAESSWALPDGDDDETSMKQRSTGPSATSSGSSSARGSTAGDSESLVMLRRSMSVSSGTGGSSDRVHGPPRKGRPSSQEQTLLDFSNALLDCPEDALGVQITRLAWENFSSLQPRDLLRYVMTPREVKDSAQHQRRDITSPVALSIRFVNFLADWTASLILVQPKQKLRVRLIEKFIGIAACLRELDNFDCCMGVLAGLNAQPVFRLDATWEPIKDKPIYKRFRSLNKLMSSSRSFGAYKMALSASKADRIPYLGCHLQDITRICEGKLDMKDGLVNWSKAKLLAEHANVVADCVELAPNLPFIAEAEQLISGVPVLDDEALYALSYSILPRRQRKKGNRLRKLFEAALQSSPYTTSNVHDE